MILYMVLETKKDKSVGYRIGGGSSTPSGPKVYESRARAEIYANDRYANYYVVELDTDNLPIVYVGEKR